MDPQDFKEQARTQILGAAVQRGALEIRGGGSKHWYGQEVQGELLDARGYSGVIDYEPTELVITARCGTPLAEIEALLARHQQMLAFEPPHFGSGATLGGMVASGLSGPSRQAVGALRDFVLGTVLMDGKGEVLHFGGQVMKNVAGYDVSRLLAGSLGTLGLILEASVKVLPRPVAVSSRRFAMNQAEAIRSLNQWGGLPLPLSGSCWHDGMLTIRLAGAEAAVLAAEHKLGGEAVSYAEQFWQALREQTHPFFAGVAAGKALWRLSLPSIAEPLGLAGETLVEWGGAQRWLLADENSASDAAAIRAAASAAGGHATLFRGGDKSVGVFQPLAPAVAQIHRNLKAGFDPAGIFNRGRMYPDF
ncbi:glycolate oxidase FAD binding subunit [Collimonas sp. PA-H2]|uniref:glycolate oxidase subunit GlcE n=1 Tax=Collimonas sp. PA-H2 TaxID=1881062 RepID=UPI000BF835E8|nr:glycolate oxidase subunit GlcE [Collimonas sp. PA-H2]PFH10622.1 glycolate oxidase FAD binding subunit [Collimonas sp. PA-H2]